MVRPRPARLQHALPSTSKFNAMSSLSHTLEILYVITIYWMFACHRGGIRWRGGTYRACTENKHCRLEPHSCPVLSKRSGGDSLSRETDACFLCSPSNEALAGVCFSRRQFGAKSRSPWKGGWNSAQPGRASRTSSRIRSNTGIKSMKHSNIVWPKCARPAIRMIPRASSTGRAGR